MPIKSIKLVREEIKSGKLFDITFCTYDETRQTGGERETIEQCMLVQGTSSTGTSSKGTAEKKTGKEPNHFFNGTFNVRLQNGDIRKIHWLLIEQFNGFQVVM